MKYTKEMHAQTLYEVLSEKKTNELCTTCIGSTAFLKRGVLMTYMVIQESICKVCKEFIGMDPEIEICPCEWYERCCGDEEIGRQEVIKVSWEALSKYYKEEL